MTARTRWLLSAMLVLAVPCGVALAGDEQPAGAGETVKHDAKTVGETVSHDAKVVGKAVGDGATTAAKAVSEDTKKVTHVAREGADKTKDAVAGDKTEPPHN